MNSTSSDSRAQTPPLPSEDVSRRRFLRQSLTAAVAAPLVMSLEEQALAAQDGPPVAGAKPPATAGTMPTGKLGPLTISRLICGGNLISGFAHSRDLTYVSSLLKHYHTDEKIMETWARCEEQGINAMVASSSDPHAIQVYRAYTKRGGKIQYIAQINPTKEDLTTSVKQAADAGAVAAFLLGNIGDKWTREGSVNRIGALLEVIRDHGLVAGVAGHELRTPQMVEEAGLNPDFYVKTLHGEDYWSKRRPDQTREVIDNYKVDNYWCIDPAQTIGYMARVKRPWIAYKVLAAGAIPPRDGFRFAFESGADFALVGMFDFQVAADVTIARQVLASKLNRSRAWLA
jgi:hypothetical protein